MFSLGEKANWRKGERVDQSNSPKIQLAARGTTAQYQECDPVRAYPYTFRHFAISRFRLRRKMTRTLLERLYHYMRLNRTLEERMVALKRQGRIVGGVYRSLGQEANSVGSAMALDEHDILFPLIRNIGSILVRGAQPIDILRQMTCRSTSPTKGRELGFHYSDLDQGFVGHVAVLGDMVPVAAGVALSFKMKRQDRVALCYAGDGQTNTGAFHEGLNLAAVQMLPLVMVVEYNHYAYSTPAKTGYRIENLADRANAYGIPAQIADGNDVLEVYDVTRAAVDRARNGSGVQFIELKTYRRTGHAEHDPQAYVPEGEPEWWAENNDPIDRFRTRLLTEFDFDESELKETDERIASEIDRDTDKCLSEPEAEADEGVTDVWSRD